MSDTNPTLRELKIRAQSLKPALRLGKAGLTPEFMASLIGALNQARLVKVKFEGFKAERKDLTRSMAEQTGSQIVQQVGHTAVFHLSRV